MFLVPLATAFSPRPGIAGPEGRGASGATGALRPGQLGRRHRHDRPLVSCWIGVATGANKAQWNGTTTVALVAGLAIVTALDVPAVVMLVRALRLGRPDASHSEAVDDWLGDAILVARRESRRFGPFRPHVTSVVAWCDRTVIARLRRHPILGAALASVVFGTGVGLNQGIREGYLLASTLPTVGLFTCGMFDFLMLAGSYLVVVCSGSPLAGVPRRLTDATVIACIAALVALAFLNSLWWFIGTNADAAGDGQFVGLLGIAVATAFAAGFAIQSIMGTHARGYEQT